MWADQFYTIITSDRRLANTISSATRKQNETNRKNSTTKNTKLNNEKQDDKVRTNVHINIQF